jgi:hypothetical protein
MIRRLRASSRLRPGLFQPERDRRFESLSLQRRVCFTHRADSVAPRFDPIFTPMGPLRDGPRGAENFKNRLEKRAENPAETGAKGVEKRAARLGRLQGDGGRD